MSELKTKPTNQEVEEFIQSISDEKKAKDCFVILEMMKEITQNVPKMWGSSIIGFGEYNYKHANGKGATWFITGFSPRKQNLTFYIMPGFSEHGELLGKLGKFKTGKSCLYVKKLEDIDMDALRELVQKSVDYMNEKYNTSS